jgi:hypothetical protein
MEEFEHAIKKIMGNVQRPYIDAKEMGVMFA